MKCGKLLKEAFEGIDFRYKLDDTLNALPDNQKFNKQQLEGYLLKQGVSPKEIKQSGLFNIPDTEALPAGAWKQELNQYGQHKTSQYISEYKEHPDITLGEGGVGNKTYQEELTTINEPKKNPPAAGHFEGEVGGLTEPPKDIALFKDTDTPKIRGIKEEILEKEDQLEKAVWNSKQALALEDELDTLKNKIYTPGPEQSLMGWTRTHEATVNGKLTTILDELQSDWAQMERALPDSLFESSMTPQRLSKLKEQYKALGNEIEEIREQIEKYKGEPYIKYKDSTVESMNPALEEIYPKLYTVKQKLRMTDDKMETFEAQKRLKEDDRLQELHKAFEDVPYNSLTEEQKTIRGSLINFHERQSMEEANKLTADFPMNEKKFQQFQIVSTIDKAIKNGTDRVAIPINRTGELIGTESVTKFYESLGSYDASGNLKMFDGKGKKSKQVLAEIKDKLEYKIIKGKRVPTGLKVKIYKEKYSNSTAYKPERVEEFLEFNGPTEEAEAMFRKAVATKDDVWLEGINPTLIKRFKEFTTSENYLHVIEIVEKPKTKVSYNMYSVLGSLGMARLAESIASEEDK